MTRTVLVLAAAFTGLAAGLFAAFSYAVMPGLRRTDDRSFAMAMRSINAAILNPVFGVVFVGTLALLVAALVVGWDDGARWWLVAALALYVATLVITGAVNVPLNDALAASTDDVAARSAFESTWVAWNHVRSVTSTASLVALLVAVSHG